MNGPATGRVAYRGAVYDVTPAPGGVLLPTGAVVPEEAVVWLVPFRPRAIIALGLNYGDHARELRFEAPPEPIVFFKGPNALVGHRGTTPRPRSARMMHFETELAVVIGRRARFVPERDAYAVVAGYTVANDYAVRDDLENYYRPNLRAKNRDRSTPIGPWLVASEAVPDPMNLPLRTVVNGRIVQEGNTRDMLYGIPEIIAYLSRHMTLDAGDVILTGTPKGVENVVAGDVVESIIDGVGRLLNTLVDDG
ncbi:fumarylacetoacetate hydrolase family protein [Hydrogenibacillus sp. N12]|uniref:fumarylacetoacetate hydrolase family protein n=1 Tax=Hydrogenibacillus sp. N12 TaxID=2866627 RepID=UPI001C7DCECF|nr:fumarylacetoacetate hydrolase family protein [Hydrogenibacillus sp. N12]QZA31990.1 fumarylacetoacetate hydrolase family protein [Hydrogenibacillus sp. N12]